MSDEEVLKYLSNQSRPSGAGSSVKRAAKAPAVRTTPQPRMRRPPRPPLHAEQETFKDFSATHLLCPKCKQAMPVREKILLYLPTGKLFDYCCERCGTSVGTRKVGI